MNNPRQPLPGTRSSALPYPTAPGIRSYKRHARLVENFDHCHHRQLGRRRARERSLDMSNPHARHVEPPSPGLQGLRWGAGSRWPTRRWLTTRAGRTRSCCAQVWHSCRRGSIDLRSLDMSNRQARRVDAPTRTAAPSDHAANPPIDGASGPSGRAGQPVHRLHHGCNEAVGEPQTNRDDRPSDDCHPGVVVGQVSDARSSSRSGTIHDGSGWERARWTSSGHRQVASEVGRSSLSAWGRPVRVSGTRSSGGPGAPGRRARARAAAG